MARAFFYLTLCTLLFCCAAVEAQTINVAQEPRVQYKRDEYLSTLLEKALIAAQYQAKINHVIVHPHQQRALISLEDNNVDLYWSMTSPERETLAIAIKIPLYRGYIGKRALVTNRQLLPLFEKISTIEQLEQLSAAQGHDWPDTKILAHNGLTVRPLANYEAMFALTAKGKTEYFPRSFVEVISELKQINNPDLAIVPNLFISYPAAFYYFVSKEQPELASAIEKGLIKMEQTGAFSQLFDSYFLEDLKSLPYQVDKTTELELINPFFEN